MPVNHENNMAETGKLCGQELLENFTYHCNLDENPRTKQCKNTYKHTLHR